MADNIRMDSHKLIYHPQRVADYLSGKTIYPIEMEIGLSGACNHRCIFCAVDYMEYNTVMLDSDVIIKNLKIMAAKGLKSIIFSGEGEPLLNKNASSIINKAKLFGIDCALSTNGVLLTEEFSKETLASLTWIRFSIAAATEKAYQSIHQSKVGDLAKVFENIEKAVDIKKKQNLRTTLGAQLLLLPENKDEVVELAKKLKEIGLDYFTIKPYSQHPQSKLKRQVDYSQLTEIEDELNRLKSLDFNIVLRKNAIETLGHEKQYDKCRGLPFMAHIDAKGDIYPCVAHVGVKEYRYGNLYEQDFDAIWENEGTSKIRNSFQSKVLHDKCREACRLDEINKYLEVLAMPGEHVNFI